MPDTFELTARETPLETYEWDDLWWEQTGLADRKRVLYIGDSISRGIRHIATRTAENSILFDSFATSKAVDNPHFISALRLCMEQQGRRDAVLFNNGLHGWHLSAEEYERYYREMLTFLTETADAPVYVVLTTGIKADFAPDGGVEERNEIAARIASKLGCPIIDLYAASKRMPELYFEDGCHFLEKGYERLAEVIVSRLKCDLA